MLKYDNECLPLQETAGKGWGQAFNSGKQLPPPKKMKVMIYCTFSASVLNFQRFLNFWPRNRVCMRGGGGRYDNVTLIPLWSTSGMRVTLSYLGGGSTCPLASGIGYGRKNLPCITTDYNRLLLLSY